MHVLVYNHCMVLLYSILREFNDIVPFILCINFGTLTYCFNSSMNAITLHMCIQGIHILKLQGDYLLLN